VQDLGLSGWGSGFGDWDFGLSKLGRFQIAGFGLALRFSGFTLDPKPSVRDNFRTSTQPRS